MPRDHDAERQRDAGFDDPGVDANAVHPATRKRIVAESELTQAISRYVSARVLHRQKEADQDYVDRCRDEMRQSIKFLEDACYAELDDMHGLGKDALDVTRDLVTAATPYHSAHIVSSERLRELAELIGVEVQS